MAADALRLTAPDARRGTDLRQPDLYEPELPGAVARPQPARRRARPVCAGCRAREARYGFRDDDGLERPRTLCFECFRLEIARRQAVAEQLARSRIAARMEQMELPLSETLSQLAGRRRRAQIAARRALGL